ncbi:MULTISPECIES: hypothetical protein [unclassified Bradyrhizobium]|uniref:hypothetical protein n=1 Tax=unclassified Bradyrhizobium TaxID=2631580 RepID=UPI001CD46B43|nr:MULTISPECIES: hypothetical protein [unclassified Bradyrhizobium]MCA1385505.1 hypothetical protein [Bradyrhizobium sp. BRP05]MCA1422774.1 hypothetical protein [Bradyrhizobium sp. BRP23]MCA1480366.1 hypothetical protein [Bradyrhizobium sp. NBAIM08]MCA1507844.1 hypothetical protein [Bradyrhizobium sp. NBAIM02]
MAPAELLGGQICSESKLFFTEAHDAVCGSNTKRGGHSASALSIASFVEVEGDEHHGIKSLTWPTPIVGLTELARGDSGFGKVNNAHLRAETPSSALRRRADDSCYTKMTPSGQRHPLAKCGSLSGRLRALKGTVAEVLIRGAGIAGLITVHGMDEAFSSASASALLKTSGVIRLVVTAFCVRPPIVLATSGYDYAA